MSATASIALSRPTMTVDVFTQTALLGNPVAVVLGADAIDRLIADGQVRAGSRVDLVRSGVALAVRAKDKDLAIAAHRGSMAAQRYFFNYELPKISAWLQVVKSRDMTCANMEEEAF